MTNIVKTATADAAELKSLEVRTLRLCVAECFVAEVQALPNLKHVYLLGADAADYFSRLAWPHLDRRVSVYELRHPSYAWAVPNLDEMLRRGLDEPFLRQSQS